MSSHPLTVAVVAFLVALTACTGASDDGGSASSSSPATSPAPSAPEEAGRTTDPVDPAQQPSQGDCYRFTFEDLARASNDHEPVQCRRRHNAQTIHVGRLRTVVDAQSVPGDSTAVLEQVSTTCPRKLRSYLGGDRSTRRLSRFTVLWFTPTVAQVEAGAEWFRCDVIAFAGHEHLATIPPPRRLNGVLDDADNLDTFGLCGTAAPGAPGFDRVICSGQHSWRTTSTIRIDGGSKFPGVAAVRNAGDETCKDRVRELAGSSLRFRYGWEWPTRDQWRRGQHYGFCWAPD